MDQAVLTVLIILSATILLLVFEVVRLDLVAFLCLLALSWSGILTPQEAFAGFSSNAVVVVASVMILGQGITKTGLMDRYARLLLTMIGKDRAKLVAVVSLASGSISAFIQNVGAAALFLPGIKTIARHSKIPASSLIMPIGFATILGGSLSMVGSGSLIVVNDLLRSAGLPGYSLFSVTPVGLALLVSCIVYFYFFGNFLLPRQAVDQRLLTEQEKLVKALNLPNQIWLYQVPEDSSLIGLTTEQSGLWDKFNLHILGLSQGGGLEYAPWRKRAFEADQELAILGDKEAVQHFVSTYQLKPLNKDYRFATLNDPDRAGFAEVIIPPRSELVGQTIRQYGLRKRYAVEPVLLFSRGEKVFGDFSDRQINPGDTIIVHGLWENISSLKSGLNFVVITPFSETFKDQSKTRIAAFCFLGAIALTLAGASIAQAFLTGAVALVMLRVITIQEAYQAIEWKVIFLLSGLIPLGAAMQKTGAATFLAEKIMLVFHSSHPIFILAAIAVLSSLLSLFISNVGSVVVLAPLVISMAAISNLDPRPLVLLAAVSALNSFILPTHQVNAMLITAGGYRNADYLRAGGGLTLLFIIIVVLFFYLFYI